MAECTGWNLRKLEGSQTLEVGTGKFGMNLNKRTKKGKCYANRLARNPKIFAFLSAKVDADCLEVLRLSLELVWLTQVIKQR